MESFLDRIERFTSLLPNEQKDLIILKGHLLIEEVLTEILEFHLERSNPLGIPIGKNMSFNQKLNLSWALENDRIDNSMWELLKDLNSIRNAMAHNVEPKNIDSRVKKFTKRVIDYSDNSNGGYKGKDLEFSISWL